MEKILASKDPVTKRIVIESFDDFDCGLAFIEAKY